MEGSCPGRGPACITVDCEGSYCEGRGQLDSRMQREASGDAGLSRIAESVANRQARGMAELIEGSSKYCEARLLEHSAVCGL